LDAVKRLSAKQEAIPNHSREEIDQNLRTLQSKLERSNLSCGSKTVPLERDEKIHVISDAVASSSFLETEKEKFQEISEPDEIEPTKRQYIEQGLIKELLSSNLIVPPVSSEIIEYRTFQITTTKLKPQTTNFSDSTLANISSVTEISTPAKSISSNYISNSSGPDDFPKAEVSEKVEPEIQVSIETTTNSNFSDDETNEDISDDDDSDDDSEAIKDEDKINVIFSGDDDDAGYYYDLSSGKKTNKNSDHLISAY
ncbi:10351_t:CDS:2, partial [Ambispora gerdemannii]